ncbi:MAG: hypothetical protein HUJ91_08195 [Bacteroidales bacterium]|nr:hypothetical protein [Bacteroidales bacterium]
MAKIVYWVGLALAIWCVYDLFTTKTIGVFWKILISIAILSCSWIGLLLYYFIFRNMIK